MFRYFFLSSLILCFSCKNKITLGELDLLNGYWSIDYITHKNETFYPKGTTKLLDFYEVNDRDGIRKKTQPQMNNKFLVTKDLNNFKIKFINKNYYLSFQTVWDQWEEKVIKLNQNKLVLEHQEKIYHYKRFDNTN